MLHDGTFPIARAVGDRARGSLAGRDRCQADSHRDFIASCLELGATARPAGG
jgi:hypothetical protein